MKYVVKFDKILMTDGEKSVSIECYLHSIKPTRSPRPLLPLLTSTIYLSHALIYDDWCAASAIVNRVSQVYSTARIYGVEEKEIFVAKLSDPIL